MNSIKQYLLLFIFFIISLDLIAQESETRVLKDYNSINIMGKMRAELYKSDSARLEISVSNAPLENVISEIKDSLLSIRLKTDTDKNAVIKVSVFYTDLKDITVAANTLLVSPEVFKAENINLTARSGAKMELELDINNLDADVRQGAILVLSGKTSRQKISVNTGATFSGYKLKSDDSYVTANSGSKAKVCAARIIDATSNTKSYIGYIGVPVSVFIKTNLGGEIASFSNEDAVFED